MKLRCNNCNEIIEEFGCNYNADVTSCYSYNEEEGKFKLIEQELNNDSDVSMYCMNCGKDFSYEIASMLEH